LAHTVHLMFVGAPAILKSPLLKSVVDIEGVVSIGVAAQLDLVVAIGMRYNQITKSFEPFVSPATSR
jgi:hypothetical protein